MGVKKLGLSDNLDINLSLINESRIKSKITCPEDVFRKFKSISSLDRECFLVALLNIRGDLIGINLVSIGGLAQSVVHPRETFKEAIVSQAASIILIHNHPSGDPTPSEDDLGVTERLRQAGQIIGIELTDHLIIANGSFKSFLKDGLLKKRKEKTEMVEERKQCCANCGWAGDEPVCYHCYGVDGGTEIGDIYCCRNWKVVEKKNSLREVVKKGGD